MSYKMTIHMKKARASPFEKTFERRSHRMMDLVMRTLVKVDFQNKDVGIIIENVCMTSNVPMGFLKFDDKVWTGKEIAQFCKYIDISSEFGVSVTFLEPEPVTIPT